MTELIKVGNAFEIQQKYNVEPLQCFVVEEMGEQAAYQRYFVEFGVMPKVCYKWAWVFYMPKPEVEDLPLFAKGEDHEV